LLSGLAFVDKRLCGDDVITQVLEGQVSEWHRSQAPVKVKFVKIIDKLDEAPNQALNLVAHRPGRIEHKTDIDGRLSNSSFAGGRRESCPLPGEEAAFA
jgi:hypothetical protein